MASRAALGVYLKVLSVCGQWSFLCGFCLDGFCFCWKRFDWRSFRVNIFFAVHWNSCSFVPLRFLVLAAWEVSSFSCSRTL